MKALSIVGLVLLLIGVVALAYGGVGFTRTEKVLDAGPFQVSKQEREFVPLSPVLGGVAVVCGAALLFSSMRTSR